MFHAQGKKKERRMVTSEAKRVPVHAVRYVLVGIAPLILSVGVSRAAVTVKADENIIQVRMRKIHLIKQRRSEIGIENRKTFLTNNRLKEGDEEDRCMGHDAKHNDIQFV
jgi:hypothetical protein